MTRTSSATATDSVTRTESPSVTDSPTRTDSPTETESRSSTSSPTSTSTMSPTNSPTPTAGTCSAVPSVDGTSAYTADIYGTTYSASLAGGTGSNRLLVVRMVFNGANDTTASGVTWNNVGLANLYTASVSATYSPTYYQVWYLTATASGTNTLAVNFGTATNFTLSAVWYTGVNQNNPLGAHQDNASQSAPTSYTSSLTTTAPDSLVSDFLVAGSCGGTSAITPGGGQSQEYAKVNCSSGDNDIYGDNIKTTSAGAYSLSYTLNPANGADWDGHTLEILGVGCSAGTPTNTATPGTPTVTQTPSWTPTPGSCTTSASVGATTSFTSYEAEAGTLGGGAAITAVTTPPNTEYSSPALEASGHAFVALTGNGQYVQWTNNTGQNITAINLRSSIPDAPAGGGITSTIDLYVNGAFRQAFPVNSQQNYVYQGTTYGSQTDKTPSDGQAWDFWNDTHAFVTGAPIAPGSTFSFQMDTATNTASYYYLDVVDVENPPAALSQPANSLSIAASPYNAMPNNSSIDNTAAINQCFTDAQSQGKTVWIPSGIWYISAINGGLNGTGITIQGAGEWYSTIYRETPAGNTQGIANIVTCYSCTMENLALDCNAVDRAGNNNNGAINFSGDNWLVDNVWAQHVTSAVWCGGNGGVLENCRFLSTWADGGNFNNVQDPRGIGENLTYTNNFVRGTGDDAMAINSVNYNGSTYYTMMSNITYSNNTAIAPWAGKCIGIYGGVSTTVKNNLLCDTARYLGLGVMRFGVNGSDLLGTTVTGNVLLRCGGNGYNQQQQAMMIGNGGDGQSVGVVENAYIEYNTITDALFDGVGFSAGTNNVLQNNTINAPRLNGMAVGSATADLGTCNGSAILLNNTVNSLNSGQVALAPQSGTSFPLYTPTMASSYNTGSGVTNETCSEGGQDTGSISNGSYTVYNNVNLANMVTFIARVASAGAGGSIQIRLDSASGTLIGTCAVPVTGCWQSWTQVQCPLSGASGTHNLYLMYTGGSGNLFNIEWFVLSASANSAT